MFIFKITFYIHLGKEDDFWWVVATACFAAFLNAFDMVLFIMEDHSSTQRRHVIGISLLSFGISVSLFWWNLSSLEKNVDGSLKGRIDADFFEEITLFILEALIIYTIWIYEEDV